MSDCHHERIAPRVFDQTLGVSCPDCPLAEWCWAERHVSEDLWNLACRNDAMAVPCDENRHDHCAVCGHSSDDRGPAK